MKSEFYAFDRRTETPVRVLNIDFESGRAAVMAKNTATVYMSGKEPNPIGSLRKLSDISLDTEFR
jgi:hypothetical protein